VSAESLQAGDAETPVPVTAGGKLFDCNVGSKEDVLASLEILMSTLLCTCIIKLVSTDSSLWNAVWMTTDLGMDVGHCRPKENGIYMNDLE
jgi:hypothetical protein